MKKLIEEMNERAAQAFERAGYDPSYLSLIHISEPTRH